MSSYSFYPGTPSFLAMKYLRTYTPSTNLMPGERYRLRRNMESKVSMLRKISWNQFHEKFREIEFSFFFFQVPGYRDIANELRCVSEEIENQRFKSPEREQAPPTWIRNSPVGYVSQRTGGNTWIAAHYPSNIRFSRATTPMLTSCGKDRMDHVYRYYGRHRY